MRVNTILTLIFVILSSMYCCESNSDGLTKQTGVTKRWQWENNFNGFSGISYTINRTQNNNRITNTPNSVLNQFTNDSILYEIPYSIVNEKSINSVDSVNLLRYASGIISYAKVQQGIIQLN